ncbi:MAG: tRNA (5-methylaminomethyl-2-thiouridine)(34)-methyltransferase MnmD [Fibrobacter sp.]|nr:tRNA (5-methylaminomethyl-2-thiouridine)(34)-methyltransferase MnmD [Fibrobacter sp.]
MQIPPLLVNEFYNDRYFDVINAVEESWQIFIDGNHIIERLSKIHAGTAFCIGETGFGAGRNVVALMERCCRNNCSDVNIKYYSVELHPLSVGRMSSLLEAFSNIAGAQIDLLIKEYSKIDITRSGWQRMFIDCLFGQLEVNLFFGEALEMVTALKSPCDAWFLDGHGPAKNPMMWREELLLTVGKKTVPGGTCATYTVAGTVRRALQAAGFVIEKCNGFGGKKSVLRGKMHL